MGLLISLLIEKLLEACIALIMGLIISTYRFHKEELRRVTMSWGGLLIALAAAIASYMPHVDPHNVVIVQTIGALLAALGESILKPPGANPPAVG